MKIGFIGVGNMAKAIIQGLLNAGFKGKNIFIHSKHKENYQEYAKQFGLNSCDSNAEVIKNAEYTFLAVKPSVLDEVLLEIKDQLKIKPINLISVVTGVSLSEIEQKLDGIKVPLIRTMPNVNVEINQGMTALCANDNTTTEIFSDVKKLFEFLGEITVLDEKDFSTFVALAGSSPAFVYFFIDALSRAGVKYGINKKEATKIVTQAVLGSAAKILKSNKNPWELVDEVSSPGGSTVAGVLAMEEAGFMTSIIKGVDATIKKDKGLEEK